MQTILTVLEVIVALSLIVLVLLQQGKGADAGAAFGGGNSGTVFGASGSGSFLTRLTAILATAFFALTLTLAIVAGRSTTAGATGTGSVTDNAPAAAQPARDDVPAPPGAAEEGVMVEVPEPPAASETPAPAAAEPAQPDAVVPVEDDAATPAAE